VVLLTPVRDRVLERRADREPAPPLEPGRTLVDLFLDRVARWSERAALRYVEGGIYAT